MGRREILTLNGGSSSIKFAVYEGEALTRSLAGEVERIGSSGAQLVVDGTRTDIGSIDHRAAGDKLLEWLGKRVDLAQLSGVGHRVVHGGSRLTEHAVLTSQMLEELRQAVPLDPAHLPREIALMEAVSQRIPAVRQVACFDTAFHRGLPTVATLMPIPRRFSDAGVRRLGFHGLSYTLLMQELARVAPAEAKGKVILAHLGSGASMAAVSGGQPVDTTMGFTPLGGLVMGTRPGDLDPGVITHMARTEKLDAAGLDKILSKECGLAGMSGGKSDVRDLLQARATDAAAREALDVFCYQARKTIGALAAAMGGVDALIFTGGIGEHAWQIRAEICQGLGFLGVEVDENKNEASIPVISPDGARVRVRVIRTNEELVIAQTVRRFLQN